MNVLSFIEAKSIYQNLTKPTPLTLKIASSATWEPLIPYIQGYFGKDNFATEITGIPYGTLGQFIFSGNHEEDVTFLLLPWDFISAFDWRTGFLDKEPDFHTLHAEVETVINGIKEFQNTSIVYIKAPVPPILADNGKVKELLSYIDYLVSTIGGITVESEKFSLSSYLAHGLPITGADLSLVAQNLATVARKSCHEPKKVLVTDLDNTLWAGIIGEDGTDGIDATPQGKGYKHYIYQNYLKKLAADGTILAVASRNNINDVHTALSRLTEVPVDCFVTVMANYGSKSSMIKTLAKKLNLGLDSFVFIDDNSLELAEVKSELAAVTCVQFPHKTEEITSFLNKISEYFTKLIITNEDRNRNYYYKNQLKNFKTVETTPKRMSEFLKDQQMVLILHDRSKSSRVRAEQLINKTNQFNLNGKRWKTAEIDKIIDTGGRLITATLEDKSGSHGEVIAILLDGSFRVRAFVMSCRTFQRRIEYAFINALYEMNLKLQGFDFVKTEKNQPFQNFITEPHFDTTDSSYAKLNAQIFKNNYDDGNLFMSIKHFA